MPSFLCVFFMLFYLSLNLLLSYQKLGQKQGFLAAFLDVGQGSSLLIETPRNCRILIDTGKFQSFASSYSDLYRFFKPKIHILVLTHADTDHIGDIDYLIQNFDIQLILFSKRYSQNPASQILQEQILFRNLTTIIPQKGDSFEICGIRAQVLHPQNKQQAELLSLNDSSIVLDLNFREQFNLLVTGDLGYESELLGALNFAQDRPYIYLAGHHGSRYSSDQAFLEDLQPEFVVIQASRQNPYGHPHPKTIHRLCQQTNNIFQPAIYGSILFLLPYDSAQPGQRSLEITTQYPRGPPQECG